MAPSGLPSNFEKSRLSNHWKEHSLTILMISNLSASHAEMQKKIKIEKTVFDSDMLFYSKRHFGVEHSLYYTWLQIRLNGQFDFIKRRAFYDCNRKENQCS